MRARFSKRSCGTPTSPSPTVSLLAKGILGDAYDKLGRYSEAYAAFTEANALQHAQCAPIMALERGPLTPASVARLSTYAASVDLSLWDGAPSAKATPVFLVGFPRSGTTLLDQILASHSKVTTLEERDTLLDSATELMADGQFERWAKLSDAEIEALRERYWQRVRASGFVEQPPRVFIDKQPLNAVLLPLIYRLFPSARIILAIRDPRDVVLSCYQQRFGMNAAMYQLLRLDSATAYYDAVMRLISICRARFPLQFHVVRYEDVVAKFESTLSDTLAFLGLSGKKTCEAMRRRLRSARSTRQARPRWSVPSTAARAAGGATTLGTLAPIFTSSCRGYRHWVTKSTRTGRLRHWCALARRHYKSAREGATRGGHSCDTPSYRLTVFSSRAVPSWTAMAWGLPGS